MKTITFLTFTLCLFIFINVQSQISLPYATGFDSAAEQQGWDEYRLGYASTYQWTFNTSFTPATTPNCLFHDYNVGGSTTDTIKDWFVSPGFDFSSGGLLFVGIAGFAIMGTGPGDYFGIWYSSDQRDPSLGTYTELVDLTDFNVDTNWVVAMNIAIPTASEGYIAFVYKNVNNWYMRMVDNIEIATPVYNKLNAYEDIVKIYPNPVCDKITIDAEYIQDVTIMNNQGQCVLNAKENSVDIHDQPAGLYFVKVRTLKGTITKKILKP